MRSFSALGAYYRRLGLWRFIALCVAGIALILALAALHMWLSARTGWPEAYGFQCHRRCLITELRFSWRLLEQGGVDEIALFALLWALPVFLLGCLIYYFLPRRRRNPIQSADPDRE